MRGRRTSSLTELGRDDDPRHREVGAQDREAGAAGVSTRRSRRRWPSCSSRIEANLSDGDAGGTGRRPRHRGIGCRRRTVSFAWLPPCFAGCGRSAVAITRRSLRIARSVPLSQNSHCSEAATPPSAILYMVAVGVLFAFLDTSAKYLVLSGMRAALRRVDAVCRPCRAGHVPACAAGSNPAMFRAAKPAGCRCCAGVFLFGSTIFNFLALKTLQLAETTSIYFFAPMVITALAGPLLGEWAGWRRWLAIARRLRRRAGHHAARRRRRSRSAMSMRSARCSPTAST